MSTVQETTVLGKIRLRGFWRVVIRPTTFQERRIADYADLVPIVDKNSVRLRGWDYPHIDQSAVPIRGNDWVGQEYDHDDAMEVWRLYLSGQFIHFFALAGDWRDRSQFWPAEPGWAPGQFLYYLDTIYSFVEIFEFASRLALSPAGGERTRVEIELSNLQGRRLVSTGIRIVLRGNYRTAATEWTHCWEGAQTDLIAAPRALATSAAQDLFARFGLNLSTETLTSVQELIGR